MLPLSILLGNVTGKMFTSLNIALNQVPTIWDLKRNTVMNKQVVHQAILFHRTQILGHSTFSGLCSSCVSSPSEHFVVSVGVSFFSYGCHY